MLRLGDFWEASPPPSPSCATVRWWPIENRMTPNRRSRSRGLRSGVGFSRILMDSNESTDRCAFSVASYTVVAVANPPPVQPIVVGVRSLRRVVGVAVGNDLG